MPACATVEASGDADGVEFGLEADEMGLITQSLKVTHKREKKELRDKCGDVVAVAHFDPTSEVELEGVGNVGSDVGDVVTLASGAVGGAIIIDEISLDLSNEDFVKTSIKGTYYQDLVL